MSMRLFLGFSNTSHSPAASEMQPYLKRWRCIAEAARAWVAEDKEKEMPMRLFLGFFYHISSTGGLGEAALPEKVALHRRGSTCMGG
jgi:hypothetical protein